MIYGDTITPHLHLVLARVIDIDSGINIRLVKV